MGFLKKLFGGEEKKPSEYIDTRGVYFYVRCDNCGTITKVRADKEYDLAKQGDGYIWHKTIVDNRCFRSMPTVVILGNNFDVVSAEITGGQYVTEEEYNDYYKARVSDVTEDEPETD